MAKYVLIGGGEIGRGNTNYETKEIDEEIVKLTNKEHPIFLFIGLASSHSDSYYDTIKKIYKNLGCETVYLKKSNIINNPDIVENKISNADIIYFGGGDTIKLLNDITEYHIDKLLNKVKEKDIVMTGISAGAILLSKEGFSDSYILRGEKENHEFIKGLAYVDIIISPHYVESSDKTKELLNDKGNRKVYCISNCAALKIIDNKIDIIKSKEDAIIKTY